MRGEQQQYFNPGVVILGSCRLSLSVGFGFAEKTDSDLRLRLHLGFARGLLLECYSCTSRMCLGSILEGGVYDACRDACGRWCGSMRKCCSGACAHVLMLWGVWADDETAEPILFPEAK